MKINSISFSTFCKKKFMKKIVEKFCWHYYLGNFFFLESFKMYADPSFIEIGKRNFVKTFCQIHKSQKPKMKMYYLNKFFFSSENCFCIRFKTLNIFWDQKLNSATFEDWKVRARLQGGLIARYFQLIRKISWNFGKIKMFNYI